MRYADGLDYLKSHGFVGRPPVSGALRRVLHDWRERRRSRRELETLDDHMLRDIGITRYDAMIETHKPFWRL